MTTPIDVFADTKALITAVEAQANSAVTALTSTALESLTAITFSVGATAPTLSAYNQFTSALTVTHAWDDLSLAALPSAPNLATFTSPRWSDAFWTSLKSKVATVINTVTAGDDVDTLVTKLTSETDRLQVALYAADKERKDQALLDAMDAADYKTGARGFRRPTGFTDALKASAIKEYQFELSQVSRDLVKYIMEWAKSNYQFSIQQGVAMHNADLEFNLRYADTLLKSYSTEINAALDTYKTAVLVAIQKAEGEIKTLTLNLEAAKANALVAESKDKSAIQKYQAEVKTAIDLFTLQANYADTQAKNRIQAGAAVITGVASLAAASGQVAIGIVNA